MIRSAFTLAGLALLLPNADAETLWNVPADGPLGVVALQAQSGDVIRVQPGEYPVSSLSGGFSVVAAVPGSVELTTSSTLQLSSPNPDEVLTVSGVRVRNAPSSNPFAPIEAAITVAFSPGLVCLQNCITDGDAGQSPGLEIIQSTVLLTGCTIEGGFAQAAAPGPAGGGPGLVAEGGTCYADGCRFVGRLGSIGQFGSSGPGPGADGVRLSASLLVATNSLIQAGSAGPLLGSPSGCFGTQSGGDALVVEDAPLPSLIELWDTQLLPGSGGGGPAPCPQGTDGVEFIDLGTVPSTLQPSTRGYGLEAPDSASPGASIAVACSTAEPFSPVFLGVATGLMSPLETVWNGLPLLLGPSIQLVPLSQTDAVGVSTTALSVPSLPPGCDALSLRLQAILLQGQLSTGLTGIRTLQVL